MEHALLAKCGVFPRLSYEVRCNPWWRIANKLSETSALLSDTIEQHLGTRLSPSQQAQARLPLHLGGLGLYDPIEHAAAALVGCINDVSALIRPHLDLYGMERHPFQQRALSEFNSHMSAANQKTFESVKQFDQKKLSKLTSQRSFDKLLNQLDDPNRARLRSLSSKGATAFANSPSLSPLQGPSMSAIEFNTAEKFILGVNLTGDRRDCPMEHGDHPVPLDPLNCHPTVCGAGGEPVARHDDITAWVAEKYREAGYAPTIEPRDLFNDSSMRPDVLIPQTRPLLLDITITNCAQQSSLSSAIVRGGRVAALKEVNKIRKYRPSCNSHGYDFSPFGMENFGANGPHAEAIVQSLATWISRRNDLILSQVKHRLYAELSTILMRRNAQAILRRCPPQSSRLVTPNYQFREPVRSAPGKGRKRHR